MRGMGCASQKICACSMPGSSTFLTRRLPGGDQHRELAGAANVALRQSPPTRTGWLAHGVHRMALARKSEARGIEIKGAMGPGYEQILSPAALDFVAELQRRFGAE